MGETSRIDPFPAIDRHGMEGSSSRWGLVRFLLRSKVGGRRISPFPAAKYDQLSTFGRSARLQSQLFKIILTAPESVASAPNPNPEVRFDALVCHNEGKQKGVSGNGNPKPAQNSAVSRPCNSFPFNKALKKNRSVFSGFRPASQPHPLQQGFNRIGRQEVLCKGAMPVRNLG